MYEKQINQKRKQINQLQKKIKKYYIDTYLRGKYIIIACTTPISSTKHHINFYYKYEKYTSSFNPSPFNPQPHPHPHLHQTGKISIVPYNYNMLFLDGILFTKSEINELAIKSDYSHILLDGVRPATNLIKHFYLFKKFIRNPDFPGNSISKDKGVSKFYESISKLRKQIHHLRTKRKYMKCKEIFKNKYVILAFTSFDTNLFETTINNYYLNSPKFFKKSQNKKLLPKECKENHFYPYLTCPILDGRIHNLSGIGLSNDYDIRNLDLTFSYSEAKNFVKQLPYLSSKRIINVNDIQPKSDRRFFYNGIHIRER